VIRFTLPYLSVDGLPPRLLGVWEEDPEGLRFTLASAILALPLVGYAVYVYLFSLPPSALWPLVEASLAVLLLTPIHESLHFLAARALGVRCRWGFTVTGPTAILEEDRGREALVVALAPLVLLGAAALVPEAAAFFIYIYVLGGLNDLYTAYRVASRLLAGGG